MEDEGKEESEQNHHSPQFRLMSRRRRKSTDKVVVRGEPFEKILQDMTSDSPISAQLKKDLINMLEAAKQPIFSGVVHKPKFRRSMALRCYNDNKEMVSSTPMQKPQEGDAEASLNISSITTSSNGDNDNDNGNDLPDVNLQGDPKPSSPDKVEICSISSDHNTAEDINDVKVLSAKVADENLDRTIMRWRCLSAVEKRLERATNRFTRFTFNKRTSRGFNHSCIDNNPKNNSLCVSVAESEPPPKKLALIAENEEKCLAQNSDCNSHEKYHKATSRKTINTEVQTSQPLVNDQRLSLLTNCIVKLEKHFAACHKNPVESNEPVENNHKSETNEKENSSLLNGIQMVTPKETYKRRRRSPDCHKNDVLNNKLAKSNVNVNEASPALDGVLFLTPKEPRKQKKISSKVNSTGVRRRSSRFLSSKNNSSHSIFLRSASKNSQNGMSQSNLKERTLKDSDVKPWRFSPKSANEEKTKNPNANKKINILQHVVIPPQPSDDDSDESDTTDFSEIIYSAGCKRHWWEKSKLNFSDQLKKTSNTKKDHLKQSKVFNDVEEVHASPKISLSPPKEKTPEKQTRQTRRKQDQNADKITVKAQIETTDETKRNKKYQPDEKNEIENEPHFDDVVTLESVTETNDTKSNIPLPANGKLPKKQHNKKQEKNNTNKLIVEAQIEKIPTSSLGCEKPKDENVLQSPQKISVVSVASSSNKVVKANNKRIPKNKSKPSPIRKKGKFDKSSDLDEILVLNDSRPKNKNTSESVENTGSRMLRNRSKVIDYNEKINKCVLLDSLIIVNETKKRMSPIKKLSPKKTLTERKTITKAVSPKRKITTSKKNGTKKEKKDTLKHKQSVSKDEKDMSKEKQGTTLNEKQDMSKEKNYTSQEKFEVSDSGIDEYNGASQDVNLTAQERLYFGNKLDNVKNSDSFIRIVSCLERQLPPSTKIDKISAGVMEIAAGEEKSFQHVKFYLIFIVANGTGDAIVQDVCKTVKQDDAFFVPKDTDYSIINRSHRETLRLFYCHIG